MKGPFIIGIIACTKTLQLILQKMALSHFLRQSHFAVTTCGGIINSGNIVVEVGKKDVLYVTEAILKLLFL